MAKPKNPLLSLGARGTIADTLTFQKRGREHFAREKPIPKDPESAAQLTWRQVFKDAVAAWHALSHEEKEAWRGVCPRLTAYQCFMRSALVYVPPPIPFDIGLPAIDRPGEMGSGFTLIAKDNPANSTGVIKTVEIWADDNLLNCVAGTFYTTNGDTLKCRDSVALGTVESGAKRTFGDLSISVQAGDYIGLYYSPAGSIETSMLGFAGVWYKSGEYIDPSDEATYSLLANRAMSLYGTGEAA